MLDKVIAYIDAHRESYLQRLYDLLRIQSISTDPEKTADMRKGADWVRRVFADCGMHNEIIETARHPCVYAEAKGDKNNTALIYGHYDVQPTGDESLWKSPPFEPTLRDGCVYARGSADDKGQILAHMLAAEAWMKVAGKPPVNVKFLVEGEEEIGSPNLGKLIRDQRDRLSCQYVALSDTPKFDAKTPAITYGTKGLVYKEIVVTGPKQNLHSGSYGGTLMNPGNALSAIIATFHDAERRVTIPGFYDDVRDLSASERDAMKKLPFDEQGYLGAMGAPALIGEKGFSTIERRWARPTLDVNGMMGGFTGSGASTVIPARVMAKVSMRLVPDQNAEKISKAFDEAVLARAPQGVKVEVLTHGFCCPAYVCPLDSSGMAAAKRAVRAGFGKEPFMIREGGTLPILPLFKEVLGADSLMIGLCHPDCNAHGPNEFFCLDDFIAGIKTSAHFLSEMATVG